MRRFLVVAMLLGVATLGGGASVAPVEAAAPPPPLDACLQAGSFNIADDFCHAYAPQRGAQYGPISGIGVVKAPRGVPIALAIPGGTDVGFGPQPGEICGEFGCIRNGTSWRIGGPFAQGIAFHDGCGAEDRQDRETGKVVGIMDSAEGRLKVTGTLKGTRLALTFTASDASTVGATGRVTRRDGRTEVLLRSRDGRALASLTLVAPAGG